MKAILVGLGSAGFGWYKRLRDRGMLHAVVESHEAMKEKMGNDPYPFYTSLEVALRHEAEAADFLVNVTTPSAHSAVNHAAFDYKLPVLCEKPISFDFAESVEIVDRAKRENIPFMIAENYRHFPYVRKLKALIQSGAIGELSTVEIAFHRFHQVKRNYAVRILDDIGVHHFDMLRYLTGREGVAVQARLYDPIAGWQEEGASLQCYATIELEGGITASYTASIASRGPATGWSGNWRVEGTEGALLLRDGEIALYRGQDATVIDDYSDIRQRDTLDEFLSSLHEGREAETSGADYLKTQALVHCANASSVSCSRLQVRLHGKDEA
ncbi:Gfo/Idh/MocA family oxidoreductase [Paenibacillus sp. J5C_2022]|uniref:Gfo/Idh/MocA family protein n=1 Tax=Paenibacillus sp. J5C2022 TaxID=2977129 RepID=UPI0021D2EC62|nr:Gfo/Idh/MocA family oxidoreductase [Paenibacillus sp. J5C2022]MCU6707516.1 Gfo/Idh/MocA family oxidoreductase [Paenibacillus sp. J5C2022]